MLKHIVVYLNGMYHVAVVCYELDGIPSVSIVAGWGKFASYWDASDKIKAYDNWHREMKEKHAIPSDII